ncbi:MAG: hypothetical protein HYX80_03985 [Chloroflexi bacterium]|nr:hypothetical protein [Chloroflexota bacterium]
MNVTATAQANPLVFWTEPLVFWTAVYALATLVLALGIVVAILQIRESKRNTQVQIAMDWFRELRDEDSMQQLRSAIYSLPNDYAEPGNQTERQIIEHLISRFNILGLLVYKKYIDRSLAVEAYAGTTSLRCWYRLHKYVKKARERRGHFANYFEGYTRLSLDTFKKNGTPVIFYRESVENEGINLLQELDREQILPRTFKEILNQDKFSLGGPSMREKLRQLFRYTRLIAKATGLTFTLLGVLIFMLQFLPKGMGSVLIIFIIGASLWALDTLWSTLDDWKKLGNEIIEHRRNAK